MKKYVFMTLVIFLLLPGLSQAREVTMEGSIQGFTCVTQGKVCPVGSEDPMAAAEKIFVLLKSDGTYYFLPNLDRALLARHINDRVKLDGILSEKYKSITVTKIHYFMKNEWKKSWDIDMQKEVNNE